MYHAFVVADNSQSAGCGMCAITAAIAYVLHVLQDTRATTIPLVVSNAVNV